jgi:hypothetical protein
MIFRGPFLAAELAQGVADRQRIYPPALSRA